MNEREIFITALEKPTESERNAYLDEVCQRPGVSRGQIEALLREHAQLGAFLETPAGTLLGSANQGAGIRPDQPQRPPGSDVLESRVLGDFRILREIGRGGMGIVYEAEQISLGRRMALKVLPFASVLDERHLTRFRNEARAAASLKHPHIVGVHSVGCERGVHYYAMEYIEGRTLAEVIQQRQTCSIGSTANLEAPTRPDVAPTSAPRGAAEDQRFFRQVAQWGIQAAEGLEHAHQMGIVHRDIKPSNLLVDGTGHLWITDFGLAHIQTDANLTLTGDVLGTLRYMSPEQASGRSRVTDHPTDIYSLGVTLYELLTFRSPFPGDDRQSVLRRIVEEEPSAPRHFSKSIPRDLETIVLKAVAKEPAQRYATAQQMADDLKRFLADEPIQARRPSVGDRAGRWTRRHRPVVWAGAASLLVAVVALAISTALIAGAYQREREQRARAEAAAVREKEAAEHEKQQRAAAAAAAAQAQESAAQAAKNYETARQAVRQMLTRVADEQLAKIPEMKEVRRRLLEDAAAFYTELLKLNPRDPRAYHERGGVYDLLQQYDKVRADYEKAIELAPDTAEFHQALAAFCCFCPDVAFRDSKCGLLHMNWLLRSHPQNPAYHHDLAILYGNLGEKEKAVAEMRQAAELCTDPRWRLSFHAQAANFAGDVRGALDWEKKALALRPDDPGVHEGLAGLHLQAGEYEEAIAAATKCIELLAKIRSEEADNQAYRYYMPRADAYTALQRYREALADYDRAIQLGPFRSYTYKRRALVHFHLKDYDKALADIAKAVELKPDDTSNLRWIPMRLAAKCPDEGFRQGLVGLIDKTIVKVGDQGELSEFRAMLLATLGRRQEALAALAKVRELNPSLAWREGPIAEILGHHYGLAAPDDGRLGEAVNYLRERVQANDALSRPLIRWASQWVPAAMRGTDNLPGVAFVSELPWVRSTCGWGSSVAARNADYWSGPILMDRLPYGIGIYTNAFEGARPADVVLDVTGQKFSAFKAQVGLPDPQGSVQYQVLVDGNIRCETPVLRAGNLDSIEADVAGAKEIVLRVLNGGDGNAFDSAAWGLARLLRAGAMDPLEEPPADLRSAAEANAAFFLAEVRWRLDQKDLARRWYDKAVAWMDKNKTEEEQLRGFRKEAAKLLGIAAKAATAQEQPERR